MEAASADGRVRLLAHSAAAGYSIFESRDRRYLMHLGHPEYEPERLVFEYERDRAVGRHDVQAPQNFDTQQPTLTWQAHRTEFFTRWLQTLVRSAG